MNSRIRKLKYEAGLAGDYLQVGLCLIALGVYDVARAYDVAPAHVVEAVRNAGVDPNDREAAREACIEVLEAWEKEGGAA